MTEKRRHRWMAFAPFEITAEDARRMTIGGDDIPTIDQQPPTQLAADEAPAPDDARPFLGLHNIVHDLMTVGCLECEQPYSDAAEEAGCPGDPNALDGSVVLAAQDGRRPAVEAAGGLAPGLQFGGVGRNDKWHSGARMDDLAVRALLTAQGWTVSQHSCYDEEGVECWRWRAPAGHRLDTAWSDDYYELGLWDDLPAIPEQVLDYVAALGESLTLGA